MAFTEPVDQMVTSATEAASVGVTEQQLELTDAYTAFVAQSAGFYAEPDYAAAVETSPVASLIAPFQDEMQYAANQNQNYTQQSQQQLSAGE